jgi:lipoprotein-anchoring transpeptidase ErfK/SrfK
MHFARPLLLLILGGSVVIGILRISLTSLTKAQSFSGCPVAQTDGSIDPTLTAAVWNNQVISPPIAFSDTLSTREKQVLGATSDEKWIEVDLGKQKIIAHDGNKIFLESLISSGLTNKTPVGQYRIWYKIRSSKMEGGSKLNNTYYYLPNVPYSMFFLGDYGIHGTYWHNNFGHPMSHGCVNAPTSVAEKLFYWTDPQLEPGKYMVRATTSNPGTLVVVHD